MTDNPKKSKLPDLDEVTSIVGKLFNDVKKSVTEIVDDYKEKRADDSNTEPTSEEAEQAKKPSTSESASQPTKETDQEQQKSE